MIYAAKPQRGGRSIQANTNNPPQDPPPPPTDTIIIPELKPGEVFIPIENTAPTVPEIIDEIIEEAITPEIPQKVSWFIRLARKIKGVFRRK